MPDGGAAPPPPPVELAAAPALQPDEIEHAAPTVEPTGPAMRCFEARALAWGWAAKTFEHHPVYFLTDSLK